MSRPVGRPPARAPIPPGALGHWPAAVALLLPTLSRPISITEVAERLDISRSTAWIAIQELMELDLVDWPKGTQGTMRPTYSEVRP